MHSNVIMLINAWAGVEQQTLSLSFVVVVRRSSFVVLPFVVRRSSFVVRRWPSLFGAVFRLWSSVDAIDVVVAVED